MVVAGDVLQKMWVVVEQLLHFKCFAQEHLDVFVNPLASRQILQKQHRVLVVHLFQLMSKLQEQGCADIAVKLAEALFFREVGVPKSGDLVNIELSCQVARYPSVCEVHKDDVHRLQMLQAGAVKLLN